MADVDTSKLPVLNDLTGSLADRVYAALKSAILSLDFLPGANIRKSDVCEQLGVSRSPVSDALTKLSGEGLVDIIPQSGTRVSRLSMAAIREDTFLREALEVAASRHAALHRTPEAMARLKRNLEMQKLLIADVDKEDFIYTDAAFHEIIMSTTGVSRLSSTVSAVSTQVNRARLLMVPEPGRLSDTLHEHIQILHAIEQQDAHAAEEAMRYHVWQLLDRLKTLVMDRSDLISS
ncbi:MAG: GntR family transcriptional regulator [Roseobacter sp.]